MTGDNPRDLIAEAIRNAECDQQPKCVWCMTMSVLAELDRAGLVVVSACVCGQPIGVCHSCGQPRCWHCDPGLGRHHQPMRCNGRHEPAALPERTETDA